MSEMVRIAWMGNTGREDRDVPAVAIDGPLAVTKFAPDMYTVTHLKSGYAVCGGLGEAASRKAAVEAMVELMALPVDWSLSRTALQRFVRRDNDLRTTIRSIRRRFQ